MTRRSRNKFHHHSPLAGSFHDTATKRDELPGEFTDADLILHPGLGFRLQVRAGGQRRPMASEQISQRFGRGWSEEVHSFGKLLTVHWNIGGENHLSQRSAFL